MTRWNRQRWRRVLLYAGVVPTLVALAYTGLVVRMLTIQHDGDRAYVDGDLTAAAEHYRSAGHHNPFEDWISAFNAGVARHADGEYAPALKAYRAALDFGVPRRDECTVRINMSLADEAIGDRAAQANRLTKADEAYRAGISALEEGDCPTDSGRGKKQTKDGKAVDDRLHQKLKHDAQQRQQQKKQKEQQDKKSDQQKKREQQERERQQREEAQRQKKLQRQNDAGGKLRQQQQDQENGSGYQPAW